MAVITGTPGPDTLNGTEDSDTISGLAGDDIINGLGGDDFLTGGLDNDRISGGAGNDSNFYTIGDGADIVDLGSGFDAFFVNAPAGGGTFNVRLTFTSTEVGNGNANDSNTMANQDGGLAGRMQVETAGVPAGALTRFDDEGVTFVGGEGVTFDVRDLVAGTPRGEAFKYVILGTMGDETFRPIDVAAAHYVNAGGGNDFLQGGEADDVLVGGAGNDTLIGGAGSDTLLGGGGNDVIDSLDRPSNIFAPSINPVRDVVDAGAGDDSVTGGRLDQLDGGAGNDFLLLNFDFAGPVVGSAAAVAMTFSAAGAATNTDGTSVANFESINFNLTDLDDLIDMSATSIAAQITANAGNDRILTGSGNDFVFGGSGDDIIETGAGNDFVAGGSGNDRVETGAGDDTYSFNIFTDGSDTVNMGEGNDTVAFMRMDDRASQVRISFISGAVGNGSAFDANDGGLAVRVQAEDADGNLTGPVSRFDDEGIQFIASTQGTTFDVRDFVSGVQRGDTFEGVVLGTSGNDTLSFFPPFREAQNFYYNAGAGNDIVNAGSGADFLVGGAGDDVLNGGGGDDQMLGGGGTDTLNGGDGNDVLNGGAGADAINGGAGRDMADYADSNGAVFINLATGRGFGNDAQGDTFTGIEDVRGGGANDVLIGDGGANTLMGGAGDDTLIGGLGADVLIGGLGMDTASYEDNQGAIFVNLATRQGFGNAAQGDSYDGIENITGTAFRDTLIGDGGANVLNGGAGDDILIGGLGGDRLIGGEGNDTASYEDNQGPVSVNLATGAASGGAAAGDTFVSIENLTGTAFADILVGDGNANRLNGGLGNDTLTGGGGADTFVFTSPLGGGVDTITDFVSGTDRIELSRAVFNQLAAGGSLASGAFVLGTAAGDADDRLIYDQATGRLFYDADGNGAGAAVLFAQLGANTALTSTDFVIV